MVHVNFGPLVMFWCATTLAYTPYGIISTSIGLISPVSNGLTHLGIWDRCSFNSSRTAVRRRASALFASSYNKRDAIVLEEQERGASQVLRHSEIERNGREAKQFARRGQGKREGWMVWTLRPVGVCVGAIG
ncbi:unnamed protein product [Fusarium venenatum]|uniref:Uncharacterized protein n=1 Tax=Fusarium venenatum TaxID=56646 RepID=A0A2L2T217_9HYPO|nr:uncharacterized protein FVRRES_01176 [Fusarium venenatum]CEI64664.1 unnamed protein product [Fusarium venenatum]